MRNALVYDYPTRIFHWLFAGSFLTAFAIAKWVDDDSVVFNYHMLLGVFMAIAVLARIAWGFVGTEHARFSSFQLGLPQLFQYFRKSKRTLSHNPASSWSSLVMMILGVSLAITGYLMTKLSMKEDIEDLHELLANGFLVTVIAHVAGIVVHTIRHKEVIGLSMIDGRKLPVPGETEIEDPKARAGIIALTLALIAALTLAFGFSSDTKTLHVFGFSWPMDDKPTDE